MARSLRVLGVQLGDNLFPAGFDNPRGFWEDADVLALNQALLARLGAAYDSLSPIVPTRLDWAPIAPLFEEAVGLINQKTSGRERVFGFKDPRLSRLLWFWRPVLAQCRCDVSYVIALRHPRDVARSLACRNGFAAEKSHLLWLVHVVGCLSGTAGCARLLVNYDELMDHPEEELRRVAKTLGLPLDQGALRDFADGFLDRALRHHRTEPGASAAEPALTPLLHEVYNTLAACSTTGLLVGNVLVDETRRWETGIANLLPALALADRSGNGPTRPDAPAEPEEQTAANDSDGPGAVGSGDSPEEPPAPQAMGTPALPPVGHTSARTSAPSPGPGPGNAPVGRPPVEPDHYQWTTGNRKGRFCSYWHQIDEVMKLRPGTVLEVGAGAGFVSRVLAHAGVAVTTLELDPELRPDIASSTLDLPVPDQAFDVVLCCQVLEHFPYRQFTPAMKELHRICRLGIVLSLPDGQRVNRIKVALAKHDLELLIPRLFARRTSGPSSGQPCWRINSPGYEFSRIAEDLHAVGFRLARQYRVFENPGERVMVATKE